MYKLLCTVVLLLCCAACEPITPVTLTDDKVANAVITNMKYQRDPQTGLCFALLHSVTYGRWEVITFSNVPPTACDR